MTEGLEGKDESLGLSDDLTAREALRGGSDEGQMHEFVVETARLASDSHCEDVIVFDLRGISDVMDYMVIASGTSDRQIRSVGDDIEELAKDRGFGRFGGEVDKSTTWLILDFVDVVIHLFEPATRAHYDLEMMWGDSEKVDWKRDS